MGNTNTHDILNNYENKEIMRDYVGELVDHPDFEHLFTEESCGIFSMFTENKKNPFLLKIIMMSKKYPIVNIYLEKFLSTIDKNIINQKIIGGSTILHIAIDNYNKNTNKKTIKLLLKSGADPNKPNKKGLTSLHLAAHNCSVKIIQLLFKFNADPNLQLPDGRTSLHLTAHNSGTIDTYQSIETLLKNGAKVNIRGYHYKTTALYLACKYSSKESIEILLRYGADPKIEDYCGMTPLHAASMRGNVGIVNLLLQNKAEINIQNNDGLTALHLASIKNNVRTIHTLLNHGADPNILDRYGNTALAFVSFYQNQHPQKEMAEKLLLDYGVNPITMNNTFGGLGTIMQIRSHYLN